MRIFAYEYISGGGLSGEELPTSILCEGYSMLRSLVLDFKSAGHHVTTSIDERIWRVDPPIEADEVIVISSNKELENLLNSLDRFDLVYLVAPESDSILENLISFVKRKQLLNCEKEAIRSVSNKSTLYKEMKRIGLSVPETIEADSSMSIEELKRVIRQIGYPVVFKPIHGVGCSNLSIVKNEEEIREAKRKMANEERFLIQEFIKGIPVSVSIISTGRKAIPLSLNRQIIKLGLCSSYLGGFSPFHHPVEREAFDAAIKAVEHFEGLKGYVGVDLVLKEKPFIMEINPRLTTSYCGLRRVMNVNIAQAIIDAVLHRKVPTEVSVSGYAFFLKTRHRTPSISVLKKIYGMKDLICPPFPIQGEAWSFIVTRADTLSKARDQYMEVKEKIDAEIG